MHRALDLDARWLTTHRGIPVTNPGLTLVHLGAVVEPTLVADAVERVLVARLLTLDGVRAALARFGRSGRNGAGVLREVLAENGAGVENPDSVLEVAFARLLRRSGLPHAEHHHVIRDAEGRFLAEVDFAYPHLQIAMELDGWAVHGSPSAMARDFRRQNPLAIEGWVVLRFTWAQVKREPQRVAEEIAAARRARAGER